MASLEKLIKANDKKLTQGRKKFGKFMTKKLK